MSAEEIIESYVDLLIAQYANKPKARATVEAYVGEVVASDIFNQVQQAFDITTAVGKQLDIIGTYRGISREVFGLVQGKDFFFFSTYAQTPVDRGFALYSDSDVSIDWFFITYPDVNASVFTMTDEEYRQILQFAAAVQSSPIALADIDQILLQFFGADIELTDNEDMTITYTDTGVIPNNLFGLVVDLKILPKPAGVEVIVA